MTTNRFPTRNEYLRAARTKIEEWLRSAPGTKPAFKEYLTHECTECGCEPSNDDSRAHEMHANFVLIGCEGYFLIRPSTLGFADENWTNWEGN